MPGRIRAIRGATVVEADTPEAISERVQEMVSQILERNNLDPDQVISAIFTATDDLVSVFPATVARKSLLPEVPLLCARELAIAGSMPRCIRVMMHVELESTSSEIQHVYLHEASNLRDDPRD